MVEKTKRLKKGSISEEDIFTLLQRYSATTILALLQEVSRYPDVKIDWNALVKNTSTGISDAREYQMLWHHLAYRHALLEKLEAGAQLLDNDSDLEYEVEAFPTVSSEASAEAAACVKVLIASGLPSDSSLPNSLMVEAPLTINIPIPNGLTSTAPSENSQTTCLRQGVNITVPVYVQKQPLSVTAPPEGLDATRTASGNIPPRRKRKPWSDAEDKELIAAVQKCGEGNWANILRGDFKGDRTASQLSQRWAIIRKRRGNLTVGANFSGSQLSEARRAAHHAMSLALDMPVKNSIRPAGANTSCKSVLPNTTAEAAMVGSSSAQGLNPTKSSPMGLLSSTAKSRVSSKKTSTKPTSNSDSIIRAAAVAAGARIASSEDAQSLIKAAQAKNVVHIIPTGGSSVKLSKPGGVPTHSEAHTNVHYISTGLVATPLSSYPGVSPTAAHPTSVKAASPTVQHTPSTFATSSKMSSEQTNAVSSGLPSEILSKEEVKIAEERKVSPNAPKEEVKEDGACVSSNAEREQVQEDKAAPPNAEAEFKNQLTDVENPSSSMNMEIAESDQRDVIEKPEARQDASDDKMQMIMGLPVKAAPPNAEAEFKNQLTDIENPSSSMNMEIAESDQRDVIENLAEGRQDASDDKMQMIMGSPVKAASPNVEAEFKNQLTDVENPSCSMNMEIAESDLTDVENPSCSMNMEIAESDQRDVIENLAEARRDASDDKMQMIMGSPVKAASPNVEAEFKNQLTDVENSSCSMNMEIAESYQRDVIENLAEGRQDASDDKMQTIMGLPVKSADSQSAVEVNCENQSKNEKEVDMPSIIAGGCSEKLEVLIEKEASVEI